jgi:hypothetical protein
MSEPRDDPPTPAERRLSELLGLLRSDPPQPPPRLADDVVRSARFEHRLRATTLSIGAFGAGMIEGLALLLGIKRRLDR